MGGVTFRITCSAFLGIALGFLAEPSRAKAGEKTGAKADSGKGHSAPRWDYVGKAGPKNWGRLAPEFKTCERGADQSPIDLRDANQGEGDKLRFEYFPSPVSVFNNGHTVQMEVEKGSAFENGRGRYELAQFHFHTPSEHTLGGKSFPMEVHLVHKGETGALAVVGVLMKVGKRHPALDAVFQNMPTQEGNQKAGGLLLNANALLPRSGGYYYYPGSLTTPPCSEGVSWHILKAPIEISQGQLDAFRKLFKMNARPVAPLSGRVFMEF